MVVASRPSRRPRVLCTQHQQPVNGNDAEEMRHVNKVHQQFMTLFATNYLQVRGAQKQLKLFTLKDEGPGVWMVCGTISKFEAALAWYERVSESMTLSATSSLLCWLDTKEMFSRAEARIAWLSRADAILSLRGREDLAPLVEYMDSPDGPFIVMSLMLTPDHEPHNSYVRSMAVRWIECDDEAPAAPPSTTTVNYVQENPLNCIREAAAKGHALSRRFLASVEQRATTDDAEEQPQDALETMRAVISMARSRICIMCGAAAAKRCGHCRTAVYCGQACQRRHWLTSHRNTCPVQRALLLFSIQTLHDV